MMRNRDFDPVTADDPWYDNAFPPAMESVTIVSGGSRLNCIIYLAQDAGHGFSGRRLALARAVVNWQDDDG